MVDRKIPLDEQDRPKTNHQLNLHQIMSEERQKHLSYEKGRKL
jgi:hypothetical protein